MGIWEAVFMLVASFVIQSLFTPKVTPPAPAAFEDFEFPQSDEGTPQAVYFGECWSTSWMVLSVGDYRSVPIEGEGGGKK